jgi:hypothetical protein
MNRITFFMLFLPILGFSQSERDQKLLIRNNSSISVPRSSESTQKSTFRDNSTQNYNFGSSPRPKYYSFNPYPYSNFGWGNRWNRWGAPLYGFNYFDDWFYYDRFGYRQPARIYVYENGKRDTIRGHKRKVRLGVNWGVPNEVGGWFTIGNKIYFKTAFNTIINKDQSIYYPNVTMDVVQTWVEKNPSQNYQLKDISKGWNVLLGVGKEFKGFGANVSLVVGVETKNYQYFDGTYILSNNGKYSFRNYDKNYTAVSFGITRDFKFLSLSSDFDPIRKRFYLGAGIVL